MSRTLSFAMEVRDWFGPFPIALHVLHCWVGFAVYGLQYARGDKWSDPVAIDVVGCLLTLVMTVTLATRIGGSLLQLSGSIGVKMREDGKLVEAQ